MAHGIILYFSGIQQPTSSCTFSEYLPRFGILATLPLWLELLCVYLLVVSWIFSTAHFFSFLSHPANVTTFACFSLFPALCTPKISPAVAVLNAIPCWSLDGQYMFDAVVEYCLGSSGDPSRRESIVFVFLSLHSLILLIVILLALASAALHGS